MKQTYERADGAIVVAETAGGTGGGATSEAHRFAETHEITAFHHANVEKAEAAVLAAEQHLDAMKDRERAHLETLPKPEPEPEPTVAAPAHVVNEPAREYTPVTST